MLRQAALIRCNDYKKKSKWAMKWVGDFWGHHFWGHLEELEKEELVGRIETHCIHVRKPQRTETYSLETKTILRVFRD